MEVRDAVEADAEALAAIADAPTDVMRNLVHDRTVRVAVAERAETDPNADVSNEVETEDVLGFVSYDARDGIVYVTQLSGTVDACERLLAEPVRFASNEGMLVELLAPAAQDEVRDAAERVGFRKQGTGPMFQGERTIRYRLEP
ncbi:MAG: hypothetical protein ABEJ22_03785 [Haloferacaceae archaeon]